jgi:DNA-binding LytR/AlgR family response regulator
LVLKLNKSIVSQEIIAKSFIQRAVVVQPQVPNQDQSLILCIKSYGDYRYIAAKDICYLHADNNSTDIHLNTGEMITAFKTLKHFEGLSVPFIRIHNSYIVNKDYLKDSCGIHCVIKIVL